MAGNAGALSSLVMTLPLIAVPCLAVFGLPSLGPATAEADSDEAAVDLGQPTAEPKPDSSAAPPFGPIVDAGPSSQDPRTGIDPTFDRRGAAPNMPLDLDLPDGPPSAPPAASGPFSSQELAGDPFPKTAAAPSLSTTPTALPATPPAAPAGRTLDAAIARLNGVGIHDIRFARGETPGQVYFSCAYGEAKNVTRRFEGEGAGSLAAVEDVLRQVEKYFASRSFTDPQAVLR